MDSNWIFFLHTQLFAIINFRKRHWTFFCLNFKDFFCLLNKLKKNVFTCCGSNSKRVIKTSTCILFAVFAVLTLASLNLPWWVKEMESSSRNNKKNNSKMMKKKTKVNKIHATFNFSIFFFSIFATWSSLDEQKSISIKRQQLTNVCAVSERRCECERWSE